MRTEGSFSNSFTAMILVRIVSATRAPTPIDPLTSQTVASIIATGKVMDREETDVAQELATSLAPMIRVSFDCALGVDLRLTNHERIKECEDEAKGKDIVELMKISHVLIVNGRTPRD
jgi:hypothetical protein